jgi:hypothetical protein
MDSRRGFVASCEKLFSFALILLDKRFPILPWGSLGLGVWLKSSAGIPPARLEFLCVSASLRLCGRIFAEIRAIRG